VAEACHRPAPFCARRWGTDALIAENRVLLVPVLSEQPRGSENYWPNIPRWTRATPRLFVLSEQFPRAKLITVDDDFRRYRRLRNQAIPLVMPEDL